MSCQNTRKVLYYSYEEKQKQKQQASPVGRCRPTSTRRRREAAGGDYPAQAQARPVGPRVGLNGGPGNKGTPSQNRHAGEFRKKFVPPSCQNEGGVIQYK